MVQIRQAQDGYVVENEAGDAITLSEADILTLAQSARLLRDELLARRTRGAATPRPTAPVSDIVLNVDLHKSVVVLQMIDNQGAEEGFALPLEIARTLAERLPKRVAEIEAAEANRKLQ